MTPTQVRRFIWGLTICAAGVVLLLQAVEVLPGSAWKFIWPTFITLIGLEIMFISVYQYGEEMEVRISRSWFKRGKKRRK